MEHPSYIIDFKNITNPKGIEVALSDWKISVLSERSFEIKGREINKSDIIQLYQYIDYNGHIFFFDCQTKGEFYRQKNPVARKRSVVQDSDLDVQTVIRITQLLNDLEEI